jgi:hypothetical protein
MGTDGLTHATVRLDKALFVLSLTPSWGGDFLMPKDSKRTVSSFSMYAVR